MAPAGRAGSTQGVLAAPRPALGQRAAAAEQQLLQVLEYPRQHHTTTPSIRGVAECPAGKMVSFGSTRSPPLDRL